MLSVVSIFVNPMQFAENEDLDTYPRTLDDDLNALREAGVDLVLTPSADDIYPDGSAAHTAIHVPDWATLCAVRIDRDTSMASAPWFTSYSSW
jgi:pantoate--beta-alanine ligase